jgi:hypothetical protein
MTSDRPCLCTGQYRCHKHLMLDWRLAALARSFDITDPQWCRLLYLHENDDLNLLLQGAS